jgi:hypothetical protein
VDAKVVNSHENVTLLDFLWDLAGECAGNAHDKGIMIVMSQAKFPERARNVPRDTQSQVNGRIDGAGLNAIDQGSLTVIPRRDFDRR